MTAALMRLGIVGHRAAVRAPRRAPRTVEAGVRDVLAGDMDGPSSFAPALEIASARTNGSTAGCFARERGERSTGMSLKIGVGGPVAREDALIDRL